MDWHEAGHRVEKEKSFFDHYDPAILSDCLATIGKMPEPNRVLLLQLLKTLENISSNDESVINVEDLKYICKYIAPSLTMRLRSGDCS